MSLPFIFLQIASDIAIPMHTMGIYTHTNVMDS